MGEGRVSGWSPMLGMFSSSSAPVPILPLAQAGWTCASESCQWGPQMHYFSAGSNSDAKAEVGVGAATYSPNSTSTSPRELSTTVAVSSTEGTDCSRVSVPLARGMRLWVWGIVVVGCAGGDGGSACWGRGRRMTLMSRSKMADEEEV